MRRILFKAKRLNNGEWVEGFVFWMFYDGVKICCIGCEPLQTNDYGEIISDWCAVDEDTLCQYTGKEDKNGVKIFEGDICENDWNIYEIIHIDYLCCLYAKVQKSKEIISLDGFLASRCEVIGNIHDKEA